MRFCISKEELEKALADLNVAIKNGFKDSLAVVQLYTGGECVSDFKAKAAGVILKADPVDPSKNWGHTTFPSWQKYENGKYEDMEL